MTVGVDCVLAKKKRRESSPCEFQPMAEKIILSCEMARTAVRNRTVPTLNPPSRREKLFQEE